MKDVDKVSDEFKSHTGQLKDLSIDVKSQKNRTNILWAIVLLVIGVLISWLITKALGS